MIWSFCRIIIKDRIGIKGANRQGKILIRVLVNTVTITSPGAHFFNCSLAPPSSFSLARVLLEIEVVDDDEEEVNSSAAKLMKFTYHFTIWLDFYYFKRYFIPAFLHPVPVKLWDFPSHRRLAKHSRRQRLEPKKLLEKQQRLEYNRQKTLKKYRNNK